MARHRDGISNTVKKTLYADAGNKCANPGCSNRRTHIHHIRQWAVYQTHDQQHMIAVCPACHDAIHHGKIRIDDTIVYHWKAISRSLNQIRGHIYVEPGAPAKLLLGTIAISTSQNALIFQLSPFNRMKFSIKDGDILMLELSICSLEGRELVRVVDNHVKHQSRPDIDFQQIPGSVRVIAPSTEEFIPSWVGQHMRLHEPDFADNGRMITLGISVLTPGVARIEGVWAQQDKAVIITQAHLSFLLPSWQQPLSLVGAGEESVLYYVPSGIIDLPLFGF